MFDKNEMIKNSKYLEYRKAILTKNEPLCKGITYVRVSSDKQLENSLETQLNNVLNYALNNNILIEEEDIFVDGGISGRTIAKRTDFQAMIDKVTSKNNYKYVLVDKYDRFARNKEESVLCESRLKKQNIELIAVQQLLPKDKIASLILKNTYETNSEIYSLNLSTEVYKGLIPQAEKGKHMTRPPYGYYKEIVGWEKSGKNKKDKPIRKMRIKEEEAKVVRLMFEKYLNGLSCREIAKHINELGIKTRGNINWDDGNINKMLSNITYAGYSHWTQGGIRKKEHETIIQKGKFPPIIDENTFKKVQEIKKVHTLNNGTKIKQDVKGKHWLRGLIRCSNCGNTLVINGKCYQCCAYTHGACDESHAITINKIEKYIINYLKNIKLEDIINISINNIKIQNNDELAILNDRINQIENQLKRIMLAYENEVYTLEEYKDRKEKTINEKIQIQNRINSLKEKDIFKEVQEKVYNKCCNTYNILIDDNIPLIDKQIAVQKLFEKIIYDKKNKTFNCFYNI